MAGVLYRVLRFLIILVAIAYVFLRPAKLLGYHVAGAHPGIVEPCRFDGESYEALRL